MPAPTAEPASPISTVRENGIGSGPGTASRARAPKTKPAKMAERIVPSIVRGACPKLAASRAGSGRLQRTQHGESAVLREDLADALDAADGAVRESPAVTVDDLAVAVAVDAAHAVPGRQRFLDHIHRLLEPEALLDEDGGPV